MSAWVLDQDASQLSVWTYKAGLLSKVAHDLKLKVGDFSAGLSVDGDSAAIEVEAAVASLSVEGQVSGGGEVAPLSASDHEKIEGSIVSRDILEASRYPKIRYAGSGSWAGAGDVTLEGELTLKDAARPLSVRSTVTPDDDGVRVQGDVRFNQTTFGIKPFKALLGAIKLKDELRVSWDLRYRQG